MPDDKKGFKNPEDIKAFREGKGFSPKALAAWKAGYEDDALPILSPEEKAARWKSIREGMEGINYAYVDDAEIGIPGKHGKRFVRRDALDEANVEKADEKITFKDWIAAKRAKGEELNFIGHKPTVEISFEEIDDAPFVTEDDLLNPDDGHIIKDLNEIYALVIVGDKGVIMDTSGDVPRFLSVSTFELWFANKFVTLRDKAKKMSVGQYWIKSRNRRQFQGLVFAPEGDRPGYYNLWRGFAVKPKRGDCSKFLAHLKDNVCDGDEDNYKWVVGWFADIIQNPARKPGTSLVLRGKQGAGKTKVGEIVGSLLGQHYIPVSDPRLITGRFNAHLVACLLLHADEGFWAGDHAAEGKLKDLVTGDKQFIEYKGKEAFAIRNYLRLFVTGNPDWMVPAALDERRFAVFDVGEGKKQDHAYFAAIDYEADNGGREALLYHLLNFDLKSVNLRTIPKTAALLDQKIASMTPDAKWLLEILKAGELPWGCKEAGVCPTKVLFEFYIQHARRQGVARRSIEVQIGIFLMKHVPDLKKTERQPYEVLYKGEMKGQGKGRLYRFPPLAECRKAFATMIGQEIEWDEQAEWETINVEMGGDFSSG